MDETAFTDWSFPGRGLLRGGALARYVREHTGGRLIEQMALPLGIVATDLDSGQPILFQMGDPGTAVCASSAVPAVFLPSTTLSCANADVVMRPKLNGVSSADSTARKRSIQAGRDAALAQLAELILRVAAKTK